MLDPLDEFVEILRRRRPFGEEKFLDGSGEPSGDVGVDTIIGLIDRRRVQTSGDLGGGEISAARETLFGEQTTPQHEHVRSGVTSRDTRDDPAHHDGPRERHQNQGDEDHRRTAGSRIRGTRRSVDVGRPGSGRR